MVCAGKWRLRLLLTLLSLSGASLLDRHQAPAHQAEPPFVAWVWQQLQGPLGTGLVQLHSEADLQEAHLLCMTQVGIYMQDCTCIIMHTSVE